jgi:hypothetical protein
MISDRRDLLGAGLINGELKQDRMIYFARNYSVHSIHGPWMILGFMESPCTSRMFVFSALPLLEPYRSANARRCTKAADKVKAHNPGIDNLDLGNLGSPESPDGRIASSPTCTASLFANQPVRTSPKLELTQPQPQMLLRR